MTETRWIWNWAGLVAVRSISALTSPIMDCDETFNYWEPLHHDMFGSGLQTWEYSPEFALRTYAYITLHRFPQALWNPQGFPEKTDWFFFARSCFGVVCALGESLFCVGVERKYGRRAATLTLLFLATNSGMYHSSTAFLPSTTCMYATLFSYWAWFTNQHMLALMFGSFAVLFCWPFCALMFVPMGFDSLRSRGFLHVLLVATLCLGLFLGVPFLYDTEIYGKPTAAIVNLVLYNALGQGGDGKGADLYGTEPWHFYLQNLLLNMNVVSILGLVAPALVIALWSSLECEKGEGNKQGLVTRWTALLHLSGGFLCFALFTSMAHKEERFLAMCYPLFCFGAALSVVLLHDTCCCVVARLGVWPTVLNKLVKLAFVGILLSSVALSISRSYSLHVNFVAPLRVFQYLRNIPDAQTVCMAKEWYRFPSSFFLPPSTEIRWVQSAFNGQLPQPYSAGPNGTRMQHSHFNDKNQQSPDSLTDVNLCEYAVDLAIGDDNGAIGVWEDHWERVYCEPFLNAAESKAFVRSFYLPMGLSAKYNKYADYCLLKRI